MSWRTVVISSNAKLDLQLNYLVVRGAQTTKIHSSAFVRTGKEEDQCNLLR